MSHEMLGVADTTTTTTKEDDPGAGQQQQSTEQQQQQQQGDDASPSSPASSHDDNAASSCHTSCSSSSSSSNPTETALSTATAAIMSVVPQTQRRRKRRRRVVAAAANPASSATSFENKKRSISSTTTTTAMIMMKNQRGKVPVLADTTYRLQEHFVVEEEEKEERETFTSLLFLLAAREAGCLSISASSSSRTAVVVWQRQMLCKKQQSKNGGFGYCFRPYAKREIPFTSLQTPVQDAVLGLERTGAYVLCLGGGEADDSSFSNQLEDPMEDNNDIAQDKDVPNVSLRFYGVPSRSVLASRLASHSSFSSYPKPKSPLLLTVPLAFGLDERLASFFAANMEDSFWWSYPANLPTQFWISSDWRVGVALLRISSLSTTTTSSSHGHRQHQTLGDSLVIFPLPAATASQSGKDETPQVTNSFRLENIPHVTRNCADHTGTTGSSSDASLKKQFWNVHLLPDRSSVLQSQEHFLCSSVHDLPGYLFFSNHGGNCFRLTWFQESFWTSTTNTNANGREQGEWCKHRVSKPTCSNTSSNKNNKSGSIIVPDRTIVTPLLLLLPPSAGSSLSSAWVKCNSERYTGRQCRQQQDDHDDYDCGDHGQDVAKQLGEVGQIEIVFEARLCLDSLLLDILKRRPELVGKVEEGRDAANANFNPPLLREVDHLPLHHGELVAVTEQGRTAELFVTFYSQPRMAFIGVFVALDLFTSHYTELKWIKRAAPSSTSSSSVAQSHLVAWTDKLSLARHMCQKRAGPYSVNPRLEDDWTSLCVSSCVEPEEWTDSDPEYWRSSFLLPQEQQQYETNPPKVSTDSIYPDAHLFNNDAVRLSEPITKLRSRSAPVELGYC